MSATDPKWLAFAARLAAKLDMDVNHRYWVSQCTAETLEFVDMNLQDNGNVVMGSLVRKASNDDDVDAYCYSQYQPLTMELLQDHFGSEIVVKETDPKILADHFCQALLASVSPLRIEQQDTTTIIHVSYESGSISFLGSRPLVLTETTETEINEMTLQLIGNLRNRQSPLSPSDIEIQDVERSFLNLWETKDASEPKQEAKVEATLSCSPTAKRPAAPTTKKTVKRPKVNKKKKKATGLLKFEGED